MDESDPAHAEREESGQPEDAKREQPREPGERNSLRLGIRHGAPIGRRRRAVRRSIARAHRWTRTATMRAEIVKRAHRSSRHPGGSPTAMFVYSSTAAIQ